MPPKTKKRTRLRPAPFITIFLLINLAAGLYASRLTVIRKVRVEGAAEWDRPRLETILEGLRGVPCAQINRFRVESDTLSDSAYRSARLDRNLFGSAVLTVVYRTPVARFNNHLQLAISDEGVIFRSQHLPSDLPTLQLGDGQPATLLTLANDFPSSSIAYLAVHAQAILKPTPFRIEYGTGRGLCLNIGTGQVILGSSANLEAKLGKLQEELRSDPDYLSKIKALNLVEPKNPMTVPK